MSDLPIEATPTQSNAQRLIELQKMPLEWKILITQQRIEEWYEHFNGSVYVSFSGGKDSTVLLDIAQKMYPDIPAVFVNTGLEYPEIREFALRHKNVEEIRPRWGRAGKSVGKNPDDIITFLDVVTKYGYPLISKAVSNAVGNARRTPRGDRWKKLHGEYGRGDGGGDRFGYTKYLPLYDLPIRISEQCCAISKKGPAHTYANKTKRKAILATMTEESILRRQAWVLQGGCNAFEAKIPTSKPMSFWTEQDVLKYIVETGIEICSVYGDIVCEDDDGFEYSAKEMIQNQATKLKCTGCDRTGCIFCAFGAHLEKGETRFQRLARTHPRQYEYCIGGGEWRANDKYDPTLEGTEYWNPKELWLPNKKGLGMGKAFDMVNDIYGKDFIRYE